MRFIRRNFMAARISRVLLGGVEAKCRKCGGALFPVNEMARMFSCIPCDPDPADAQWPVTATCESCKEMWYFLFDNSGDAGYHSLTSPNNANLMGIAHRVTDSKA
jgi:hypothetical protein